MPVLFVSCATQKPTILSIPPEDTSLAIYYCSDKTPFTLNGCLLYESNSFGTTIGSNDVGTELSGSKTSVNNIFNYFMGIGDYSFILSPSLSRTGKYLIKVNDDIALHKIRFNRNVDVDIVNLSDTSKLQKLILKILKMEYEDEKYQIPWSQIDDSFFGFKDDTLYRFFPNGSSINILSKNNLYDFNISPSEKFAVVFANDSIFLYNFQTNSYKNIYNVGKILRYKSSIYSFNKLDG